MIGIHLIRLHSVAGARSSRRTRRIGAFAVVAGLTLAACGSDDAAVDPAGSAPPTTDAAPGDTRSPTSDARDEAGAWPVTVEHVFGETTIDAEPQRIVSLDVQWSDVLTALDAPLVAAADDMSTGEFFPWQELDGVDKLSAQNGTIPIEAVAAARPDLIVASWVAADDGIYEQLSAIAPTIPLLGSSGVDQWQQIATTAGALLGMPDEAEQLITDSDEYVAALAADLPGLQGKTYVLANYVPGDAIYVVADPDDGAAQLFAALGMSIDPDISEMEGAEIGRVNLSLENIGALDADLLMILTNGADTSQIPGYDALPAVQSGAVAVLELAPVSGLNTPTPLSIPYSLDDIRPALEAAATS